MSSYHLDGKKIKNTPPPLLSSQFLLFFTSEASLGFVISVGSQSEGLGTVGQGSVIQRLVPFKFRCKLKKKKKKAD